MLAALIGWISFSPGSLLAMACHRSAFGPAGIREGDALYTTPVANRSLRRVDGVHYYDERGAEDEYTV